MKKLSTLAGQHRSAIEGFRKVGLVTEQHHLYDMQQQWVAGLLKDAAVIEALAERLEDENKFLRERVDPKKLLDAFMKLKIQKSTEVQGE